MPVYYNPNAQQYAARQQNRMDDFFRQLMQMLLYKQQRATEEKRWEAQHELSERRTKAYEETAEAQKKYAEREPRPSTFGEKFMTAYKITGGDAKKAYQMATNPTWKPPKTLEEIEAEAEARARGAGTGKFAPPKPSGSSAEDSRKRWEANRADKALQAQVNDDEKYVSGAIKRFSTDRERMYSALKGFVNNGQDDYAEEEKIRIARVERAMQELDKIHVKIKPKQPLSPDDYKKVSNIIQAFPDIIEGFYSWETGESQPWVKEKQLPKDIRSKIGVNETTGKRIVWWKDRWYEVR